MSVKATALVWDMKCPAKINGFDFKPSHKYLLLSYADHADHNGRNIWPAVITMAKKTGLDERTVQRLTADLANMSVLLEDGKGPRGTNKWYLPFNQGGDKLTPPSICRGDKNDESLGDIPSGDIPSGDKLSPELKEPELVNKSYADETIDVGVQKIWQIVLEQLERDMPKVNFVRYAKDTAPVHFENGTLQVNARNAEARDWLESRLQSTIERALVGITSNSVALEFVVVEGG